MTKKHALLSGLFILGLSLFSGCQTEEMMPLHSFSSESYSVEILTPGGTLKSGDNPVHIRVRTADSTVNITDGALMFSMPAMGTMPYMERKAEFIQTSDNSDLGGSINFNMGGSWTGHVQMLAGDVLLTTTFPIHVED